MIQKLISEMHNIKSKVRQAYMYMYMYMYMYIHVAMRSKVLTFIILNSSFDHLQILIYVDIEFV